MTPGLAGEQRCGHLRLLPRPTAIVLPFPAVRRRDLVFRIARRMAELREISAEKHLANQLRIQVEAMQRRGIATERIEQERRALECAVRTTLWRLLQLPGGAA
jgi:hypothetical protein